MRPGAIRWLAAGFLALALLGALPYLAAAVVRAAIASESAAERARFAAGDSPWSWRFRRPGDVVAGRAFGGGTLEAGQSGLTFKADRPGTVELGLPLSRPVDLTRLDTLHWQARASATGNYGVAVRESLDAPLLQASMGTLPPEGLSQPIALRRLAWTDAAGRPTPPPARAAMLRLQVDLPPEATLLLDRAALLPGTGSIAPRVVELPARLSAEGLLAWRDLQHERDPLLTFGHAPAPVPRPTWTAWLPPTAYLVLLAIWACRPFLAGRRATVAEPQSAELDPVRRASTTDVIDAALVLLGPLWFIAGLGLSMRPAPAGVAMFAAGIVYAAYLAIRRQPPRWHWLGGWRQAGWPLLAVPAALALVATFGHAPVWPSIGRIAIYLGWALFQQWLVLAIAGALLAKALSRPWAVLLTALAFALLHTPNGLLMQLCFVAELGWAWWYFHRRALLPVAIAHAASAVVLQAGLAGGLLRSLEVSARYLQ